MDTVNILLLEDDKVLACRTAEYLRQHGLTVDTVYNRQGFFATWSSQYDLLILDIMLEQGNGLAICKEVRQKSSVPIIFLTALGEETDIIVGLEVGADDYIVKPFSPRELLARVRSILRRVEFSPSEQETIETKAEDLKIYFGEWILDTKLRLLFNQQGKAIPISQTEYKLLHIFLKQPFTILDREYLLQSIGNQNEEGLEHRLDVQISRLRSRLGDSAKEQSYIKTMRNSGYMFMTEINGKVKANE